MIKVWIVLLGVLVFALFIRGNEETLTQVLEENQVEEGLQVRYYDDGYVAIVDRDLIRRPMVSFRVKLPDQESWTQLRVPLEQVFFREEVGEPMARLTIDPDWVSSGNPKFWGNWSLHVVGATLALRMDDVKVRGGIKISSQQ